MRNLFPGYYRRSEDDLDKIWEDGLLVFDANVLLNLYRYSEKTREELLQVLRGVKERLWLPHQVAEEFHRDRQEVIGQRKDAYSAVRRSLSDAQKSVEEKLGEMHRDPGVLEAKDLRQKAERYFKELVADAEELENGASIRSIDQTANSLEDDLIWQAVVDIFDDRVGEGLSPEQTREVLEAGPLRYESRIPPGYKDANDKSKPGITRYGDLILWYEILDKARKARKPVLFITDDRKEDWWQKVSGKTVGPHPELANEVYREAGVLFHMFMPLDFLKWAGSKLDREITEEAAGEIEELRPIEESTVDYGELWRNIASWLASANVKTRSEDPPRWAWNERNPYRQSGYGGEPSLGWASGQSDLYWLHQPSWDPVGERMSGRTQVPDDRKGNLLDLVAWILRNMSEKNVDAGSDGNEDDPPEVIGPDEDAPRKELENDDN